MTNRRRFLAISAASIALPGGAFAQPVHVWQGTALGARASLHLAHPDAQAICARVASEISRLEDIFSLFRPHSALSELNRSGTLQGPPFELLECLSLAGAVHAASGRRFDPTIQPLWASYAEASALGKLPEDRALARARTLTGWAHVSLEPDRISMRPGMALTLNGIAQGYVADRVASMLTAEGLTNILIDTGEIRALGGRPGGGAWRVQLAAGGEVSISTRALATSAPLGTTFDEGETVGHILDPRTGLPTQSNWREITVSARSAALADALSTASCLFQSRPEIEAFLAEFTDAKLEAASTI
ncbi:FAD:protein FMN transferase [Sedimentitalea todarodis]|uniref:FAD:protein FMN transferase n=1 Tax=Sedimentitalea todarodis TaxID=1631240 RepID=A0ABU3VHD9_9RHOB|nr:FAD:protein FMN transferase [Sedimentitalea todarodis]MDU9005597.1 FAD:protein FMN transferase [Sedimentitalea todarodis]